MPEIDPPLTGKDVIDAFKADVESFFEASHAFELRIEMTGFTPICKGSGATARIELPPEMQEKPIESFADFALVLLVLGHETAHYINRHNEHYDESALESRSLEIWADFFGTKVAMVVMTYGLASPPHCTKLPGARSPQTRIDALASALATLSNSYFNIVHAKYPSATKRVGTCIAGIQSFLDVDCGLQARAEGGMEAYAKAMDPETIVQGALRNQLRIYENSTLGALIKASPEENYGREEIKISSAIHRQIQSGQPALFDGMKWPYSEWLSLDYSIPEELRVQLADKKLEVLEGVLNKLGLSLK